MAKLSGDDLIESPLAVDMQVIGSAQQVHCKDQSHQTEIMIAMKMADHNVVDAMEVDTEFHQLHLSTLSAINEEMTILDFHKLCGWKSPECRQCATGSQYRDLETHNVK